MMRITTLGTGTIALSPTRACAGYLVECDPVVLLLDCGSGVVRRLAERGTEWREITHVALTHFHTDHYGDLPTLMFAWRYGMLPARTAPLDIIGPPGTIALLEKLAAAHGAWLTSPAFPLAIHELPRGDATTLAPGITLASHPVPHTAESVAYAVTTDSARLVYTGDTGVSPELADWARGCDMLIAECSLPDAMAIPEHLTPAGCGELAARAEARHLVLTHFYPPVEQVDIGGEVRRAYAGPLTLAQDGWSTLLGGS